MHPLNAITMTFSDSLKERLSREVPTFSWECKSKTYTEGSNQDSRVAIVIRARRDGVEVTGSPLVLNQGLLESWGVDATARLIGQELHLQTGAKQASQGGDWDRLAEV
jgi:hypothetical protein